MLPWERTDEESALRADIARKNGRDFLFQDIATVTRESRRQVSLADVLVDDSKP